MRTACGRMRFGLPGRFPRLPRQLPTPVVGGGECDGPPDGMGERMETSRRMPQRSARLQRSRWAYVALIFMATLFLLLAGTSLTRKSVTVDEFGHLPAGINLLGHGEARYAQLNPPLANLLSALPLVLRGNFSYVSTPWLNQTSRPPRALSKMLE